MCGVIVVDAESFRFTNLGRDANVLITALDIIIIIWSSINCPTLLCLPTVRYFSREATSEINGPRVYSLSYLLSDLLFDTFIFKYIILKTQKYLAAIFCYLFVLRFIEILLKVLLRFHELNTIDACCIAVDWWSNNSRCRHESVYLSQTWCLYTDTSPTYL